VIRSASLEPTSDASLTAWHRLGADFCSLHASAHLSFPTGTLFGLLPLIVEPAGAPNIGVSTVNGVAWYFVDTLVPQIETGPVSPLPPTTYLKLMIPESGGVSAFTFQGGAVSWGGKKAYIGWMPDRAAGSTLFTPPVAWNVESHNSVQLAGLYDNGHLYSSHIVRQPDGTLVNRTLSFAVPGGFRAVAVWQSGKAIGVSATNRVYWLRVSGPRFEEWAPATDLPTPAHAVACFPSRRTMELLVVLEDGGMARVPVPM
jgi:hypothetical protein